MSDFFDPKGTLVRLIRGTTYESAPHQVNKAKALAPFSAVAAEAYGRQGEAPSQDRRRRRRPADAPPSVDDEEAVRVDFHACDPRLILRTMIAAMAAAGTGYEAERQRVLAYLRDTGGTAAEMAFAEHEMRHPASAEEIAKGIAAHETAVEIYAAALLATQAATELSRAFLAHLAAALRLDPAFVRELHKTWDDPPPAEPG
ncbi:MAG: DUF533 domain-containing protein [Alphaproteobacteria bacterium]|nr:DUF533 domain-containing protein [Alphaproteobacteria bacterium]